MFTLSSAAACESLVLERGELIRVISLAERQGQGIVDLKRWFTPAEALAMATSANGELLALSGLRDPYPGRLGVVEQGALADLLVVNGNPLENLDLVADPAAKFLVIMKDGRIYKNIIPR